MSEPRLSNATPTSEAPDFWSRLSRACSLVAILTVLISIIALTAPLLRPFFTWGHDIAAHPTYAFLFDRAIRQGQFPVRWVEWVQEGYGQPLFTYYQVGFYYLVELVHLVVPRLSLSLKLTVVLVWLAGGVFTFLWLRPFGLLPSTLAASVFMASPYLTLDAYVRTSYPELAAIAMSAGVLWSIDRLLNTGHLRFVSALAITTCLVLISHLPSALIMSPLFAGYAISAWIASGRGPERIGLLLLGALLGVGLSAFYVVPALGELSFVQIGKLTTSYYDYRLHFVEPRQWFDSSWGQGASGVASEGGISLQIGFGQWIVIGVALTLIGLAVARRRGADSISALGGWLVAIGAALFMMTPASAPIWNAIPPLAFVQFPWRLLMVPTIGCAALAAMLLARVRNVTVQAIIIVIFAGVQWQSTAEYLGRGWNDLRADIRIDDPAWPSTDNGRGWAFREAAYDPVGVERDIQNAPGRWVITRGSGAIVPVAVTDAKVTLTVEASSQLTLRLNSPYFPGWTILLDGVAIAPTVLEASGFMEITMPAGVHRVDAQFRRTNMRMLADLLSLLSLVAGAGFVAARSRPGDGR